VELSREQCYRALVSRDARFDGRFFVAVRTTGVYCRPICPAPPAKLENVEFFWCAAAAEEAGFRACLRCRPETAPGTPAWMGSSALVSRALRLIRQGALDEQDVAALAARLGVGERQIRRLFLKHLGTSPAAVARGLRLHFARSLIDQTDLRLTEVAFASGYRSVRQFNHAVRSAFRQSPTEIRRQRHLPSTGGGLRLRMPYREPYDWRAVIAFLAARATPGVESVSPAAYRRTVAHNGSTGVIEVAPEPGQSSLALRVRGVDYGDIFAVVERARRLFDVGADPLPIVTHLGRCPALAPLVRSRPGLRVPGAWDPFEVAVRAVLGQQVSVRSASAMCGRLVQTFGRPVTGDPELTHVFPSAETLAEASLDRFALPRSRAEAIRALARAVAERSLVLDAARGLDDAVERLCALPGIGPWTANYVAMRALSEPDAFPAADLGLRRAVSSALAPAPVADLAAQAEAWRPWRAYAAMHLWQSLGAPPRPPARVASRDLSPQPPTLPT
jgi:AraC family transcriptional regulator of adaptative response / DNA-3-methyladenine glycosylase II